MHRMAEVLRFHSTQRRDALTLTQSIMGNYSTASTQFEYVYLYVYNMYYLLPQYKNNRNITITISRIIMATHYCSLFSIC